MREIQIVGDLHGDFSQLEELSAQGLVIQVGDFGVYADTLPSIRKLKLANPVWFIDGNHEDHSYFGDSLAWFHGVPNLYYVPRGHRRLIAGKVFGFLGGASSVDKYIRLNRGMHWSPDEVPSAAEAAKLTNCGKVDVLITHAPPQSVIDKHFDPEDLRQYFGLPVTWLDPTAAYVDLIWNAHGKPPLYCGHMHRSVTEGNCRILNIGEAVELLPESPSVSLGISGAAPVSGETAK